MSVHPCNTTGLNYRKCEDVHFLSVDEVKQENNFSEEGSSISECRNDVEDSKSFQEQLMEVGKVWKREDSILPEGCESGAVHSLIVSDIKLEDNFGVEESSIDEHRNEDEDSKSFQDQLIEEEKIWKREDFIPNESCVSLCGETQLNEITFPEYGKAAEEANVNNSKPECNVDNIHLKGKNLQFNFETRQNIQFGAHIDDESILAQKTVRVRNKKSDIHMKILKCHICEYTTTRKDSLKFHIDGIHLKLKSHKCHLCEYTTTLKRTLKLHIEGVHLKLKNHKCQWCDFTTAQNQRLQVHIKAVHLKLKNHQCHLCEYTTAQKQKLQVHIEGVHLKLKNHKCHMCEYTTTYRGCLKVHINSVHLKLKDHKCHMCNFAAVNNSTLEAHIRTVHLKVKNHKCHMCEYASVRKSQLKTHINRVHIGDVNPEEYKNGENSGLECQTDNIRLNGNNN